MLKQVAEFHSKYGFPINVPMSRDEDCSRILMAHVAALQGLSKAMQALYDIDPDKDDRLWRTHLMMEELAELMEAMANGDLVHVFHELTDLLYVVLGTAVTLGLPIDAGFEAVHAANMTKPVDYKDKRVADQQSREDTKGPDYQKPDMQRVIADWIDKMAPLTIQRTKAEDGEGFFTCNSCGNDWPYSVFDHENMRLAFGSLHLVCPTCGPHTFLLEQRSWK